MVRVPQELFDAYLFDLDGTIYLGDQLLPGASRLVAAVRHYQRPLRFLSNNPTRDPGQYAAKLTGLGIPTRPDEVVNTVVTTVNWLKANHPDAVVFPIAEAPLVRALTEAGIRISDRAEEIDIVIASYDRGFDYRKLQIAFDAIWFHRRAFLIQTNPDRFCPYPGGRGQPDAAAITAAIEAATGTTCRHSFGKPDPLMLQTALATLPSVKVERVVMVGDRLHTDLEMATGAGVRSAVVLTGEATAEQVAGLPAASAPDFVLDRIDRLIPPGLWGELGWASC
ncbi:HAD superfamily hydrolase (TIGR01450 family) [Propionicimonas paludicola]|uniref:HAD superfamily hydrolase (TIGR01450 family) n=1 Tax=Propionicimonas paludicola TaxID=185243 RepID=A0A2A9CMB4_9ACTN|nr:HAD-IIA family hydrolase [Propionicimonas paludicola]PFG15597.1 HAD superfamily hydrolase (TIGR01450 family) [Propionicimonas paludicola]